LSRHFDKHPEEKPDLQSDQEANILQMKNKFKRICLCGNEAIKHDILIQELVVKLDCETPP